MAEITAAGYTRIRTSEIGAWFVELRDDSGNPVPLDDGDEGTEDRVAVADDRVTVTDTPGEQTITIALAVTGADVSPGEVELPVTVQGIVAYAAAEGGDALTTVEGFTPFVFGEAEDACTFRLHAEAPEQDE